MSTRSLNCFYDLSIAHIKALRFLREKSKSITLNCGYAKGYSVLEILKIFKKMRKNLKINFVKRRRGDVAAVFSNTKKTVLGEFC